MFNLNCIKVKYSIKFLRLAHNIDTLTQEISNKILKTKYELKMQFKIILLYVKDA